MKHRIVTAARMKAIEQAGNAHGLPYLQMMVSIYFIAQQKNRYKFKDWPDPVLLYMETGKKG